MLLKGKVKGVVAVIASIESDGTFVKFTEMLGDKHITSKHPNLYLTSSDLNVPYLIDSTSVDLSQVCDIFLTSRDKITDSVLEQIKNLVGKNAIMEGVTIEHYRELFNSVLELESYLNDNVSIYIDFPVANYDNYQNTSRLVSIMNEKSGKVFKLENNETLVRATADSELYIEIPSAEGLSFNGAYLSLPNLDKVFTPYTDPRLNAPGFKSFVAQSGVPLDYVTGNPDNNTSEIFPEEKRFYDALVSLHKACLAYDFPNNSIEDCIEHGLSSKMFRDYVTGFIMKALKKNWNHTGFMPFAKEDNPENEENDNDDDDDKVGGSVESNKNYYTTSRASLTDGELTINSLLNGKDGIFHKDIMYPINLLIQCLRFGNKKPNKLVLNAEKSYFDLNTFVHATSSGSYSSYEIQQTPSGCNYRILTTIQANNRIFDNRFLQENGVSRPTISSTVGLVLVKSFVGTTERQLTVISIVDLIANYGKDLSLTIDGLEYRNGEIVFTNVLDDSTLRLDDSISLADVLSKFNNSSDGYYVSYVSKNVRDVYMKYTSFNNKLTALGLYNFYVEKDDLAKFNLFNSVSEDELEHKISAYTVPASYALNATLGLNYVKLICEINDKLLTLEESRDISLVDVFNVHKEVMGIQGFKGDVFMEIESFTTPTQETAPTSPSETIQNSNTFGGDSSVKEVPKEVKQEEPKASAPSGSSFKDMIGGMLFDSSEYEAIHPITMPYAQFKKLKEHMDLKKLPLEHLGTLKESVIIGYLGRAGRPTYFLKPVNKGYRLRGAYEAEKVKILIMKLLKVLAFGKSPTLKFEDLDTLNYYTTVIEELEVCLQSKETISKA